MDVSYNPIASNALLLFAVLVILVLYAGSMLKLAGKGFETTGNWIKGLFFG